MVGDRGIAEDLVQETFLRVWKRVVPKSIWKEAFRYDLRRTPPGLPAIRAWCAG
ncbi:MAG: hypothetical protein IT168_13220 [Bryobacterales bacterium]|nr:hypothetical protein [Bryobacterales bacterium]